MSYKPRNTNSSISKTAHSNPLTAKGRKFSKKRVAIFGWGTLAIEILRFLINQNQLECEVVFCCPNQSDIQRDKWQPSFAKYLEENNIHFINSLDLNNPSTLSFMRAQGLDFIFSLQFNKILKKEILEIPKFGSINLHYSPLPKYRGVAAPTWAMINGEKEFGVTLHYMEPVVDKGDIIDQSIFNIEQIENARLLYDVCLEKALNLFKRSVDSILRLENKSTIQNNSKAFHYSRKSLDFNQRRINWNKDTISLTNWIKAYIFPPFQFPIFSLEGKEFEVVSVKPDFTRNEKVEFPGTVVSRSGKTFKIATDDSYIIVQTN